MTTFDKLMRAATKNTSPELRKIRALKPGRSVAVGGLTAERSSDGALVRYVRASSAGFEVVRTVAWDRV